MEKVLAVVVKTVDYNDNDKMITLLSRDEGRIDALARGCKKQTSPLMAACQPFAVGEFYVSKTMSRTYISHCNIIKTFFDVSNKMDGYAFASFVCDVANKVSISGPSERLFALIVNSLYSAGKDDVAKLTAFFMVKLSDILGFRPVLNMCAECGCVGVSAAFQHFAGRNYLRKLQVQSDGFHAHFSKSGGCGKCYIINAADKNGGN